MNKITKLITEEITDNNCTLCKESSLQVGAATDYGAVIIYKNGSDNNGWFATLSPKTASPNDFTIQLMSNKHLTHFCQINKDKQLAQNYGIAFAALSSALTEVIASDSTPNNQFKTTAHTRESSVSVATYGKCTNWQDKKEHLHIKIFPFRNVIGQPYTVDSTFEKKQIYKDADGEFVKMLPVKKTPIGKERFRYLSEKIIDLLK